MIRGCVFTLCLICCHYLYFVGEASAERIFFAGYKGGFYIKPEEEGGMELRLGGHSRPIIVIIRRMPGRITALIFAAPDWSLGEV